jgi:hypothetical protein
MSGRKKEERGRRKKNTRGFLPLAASSLLPLPPKFLLLCKEPEFFPNRAFRRLAQLFRGRLA